MGKINSLESLRGIAALSVVLYHFKIDSSFNNAFTDNAWLMVDFFFVLSGFVMALTYSDRITSRAELSHFSKRRFLRLYPLHLLTLGVFIGLEVMKWFLVSHHSMMTLSPPFSEGKDFPSLLANLFLIQNLIIEKVSWNTASWSISAEIFTYVVFACLILAFHDKPLKKYLTILLLLLVSQIALHTYGMGTSNIQGPSRCVFAFFIGCLTYDLYIRKPESCFKYTGVVMCSLSVAVVTLCDRVSASLLPFIPLLFAATIYTVVRSDEHSRFIRLLEFKPFVYLGTISYGIYLWHLLVIYVVTVISRKGFGIPVVTGTDGWIRPEYSSVFIKDVVTLLVTLVTVLLAALSYRYFERKVYRR
ncbi:MAG: acyltransferase family protein [Pontibacterium sp.]